MARAAKPLSAEGAGGRGRQARAGAQCEAGDGGWTAGRPETSRPGAAQPGPALRPGRGGRSQWRRRGGASEGRPGGRPAARPLAGCSPAAAGKQERAGRTQGEVSSCFPWLERGAAAARGAGTLAPGQRDGFFLFKASPRPPAGARVCGWAGGLRWGRSPPQVPAPPDPAGPFPGSPHLGPAGRAARFLRAGPRPALNLPPRPV